MRLFSKDNDSNTNDDPMNCDHRYEPIEEWHDPTGEAAISTDFKRLAKCVNCGMLTEQTLARDIAIRDIPRVITNDEDDSLGLAPKGVTNGDPQD